MAVALGLVGAGSRAELHAAQLAASSDIDFVGVWTRRAAAAQQLANRYDARAFTQFRELLAACDGLCFAVPPAAQSELGSIAARLGKSVLLELPIAWDVAGAEDLAEAVIAGRAVSQVAFTWRYTPAVREFLEARTLDTAPSSGRGLVLRAPRNASLPANHWRRERSLLFDAVPHVADLLDVALGEIVDVDATENENDRVKLTLEHRLVGPSETTIGSSGAIEDDQAVFEFVGPIGSTVVDCSGAERTADYAAMFAEFAGAVRTGKAHELDVRRGLLVQRVIEAADTKLLLGR